MPKQQAAATPDIVTSMDFKKQEEFFEAIYTYFKDYQEAYAEFYTDTKKGTPAFKAMVKIISASKAQIAKVTDMEELEDKKSEVLKIIKSDKPAQARKGLDELSNIVFSAFEKIGISPTIHETGDALANFWKDEEHAGLREMKKAFYDSFMLPEE
jgi:hypothetical protein